MFPDFHFKSTQKYCIFSNKHPWRLFNVAALRGAYKKEALISKKEELFI